MKLRSHGSSAYQWTLKKLCDGLQCDGLPTFPFLPLTLASSNITGQLYSSSPRPRWPVSPLDHHQVGSVGPLPHPLLDIPHFWEPVHGPLLDIHNFP